VQHLLQALVGHVAVALHGEDHGVGTDPLDPGGAGRGLAVQALQHVDVHDAYEAAVPDDADGALHDAELLQRLQQHP
jgi:hypothetical protein